MREYVTLSIEYYIILSTLCNAYTYKRSIYEICNVHVCMYTYNPKRSHKDNLNYIIFVYPIDICSFLQGRDSPGQVIISRSTEQLLFLKSNQISIKELLVYGIWYYIVWMHHNNSDEEDIPPLHRYSITSST